MVSSRICSKLESSLITSFFASSLKFAAFSFSSQIFYSSTIYFISIIFLIFCFCCFLLSFLLLLLYLFSFFSSSAVLPLSFLFLAFPLSLSSFVCFFYTGLHYLLHFSRHLIIFTSLVFQSILELYCASHNIFRIIFHFCSLIMFISILFLSSL